MILARHVGTEGWLGVPDLYYKKSVSISQNTPFIDENVDVNVLCLLESDLITPNFDDYILNKFDLILTWRIEILEKIKHSKKFLYGTKWVDEFLDTSLKENRVSFFTSNKAFTSGHLFRHEAFNYVSNISKSVYGLEMNYIMTPPRIESKNSILNNYKFSVIMENSFKDNYFTEKIIDCFATKTIPIYWGCPNISEYFDENGIIKFNNIYELSEILINLNPKTYNNLIDSIENNFEISKKYYSLWDRIDNYIKKHLEMS